MKDNKVMVNWKSMFFLVLLIVVAALISYIIFGKKDTKQSEVGVEFSVVHEDGLVRVEEETRPVPITEAEDNLDYFPEPEIPEELLDGEGDPEAENIPTMEDSLVVPPERATKAGFQAFMLEYAYTQPYTFNGVNYGCASKTYADGVDLRDSAARVSGMGNTGYIVWVLRNTFGNCAPEFETPYKVYEESEKVSVDELQVGDLGLYSDNESAEDNFYGICIGSVDGEVVFSLMDGSWNQEFPFGTNRLCYLQSQKNEFLGDSAPVKLQFFCRPELPWIPGTKEINLKGWISDGQQS